MIRLGLVAVVGVAANASAVDAQWLSTDVGRPALAGSTENAGGGVTIEGSGADIWRQADQFHIVYREVTGLPDGQLSSDIGNPRIGGSASFGSGRYTITAGGRDIWDSADEFHYVYQPVNGDVDVIARVASIGNAHPWSKAGVMIRESLTPGSRYAYTLASAGRGYAFQSRSEPSAWTDQIAGGSDSPPGWVRLVRSGSQFEAFQSSDGQSWKKIGSQFVPMAQSVYVGLAVTSHDEGVPTTAILDWVQIVSNSSSNKLPVVNLMSPGNGGVFAAPTSIQVTARASDADGTIAGVEFFVNGSLIGYDTTAPYSVTWNAPAGQHELSAVAIDDDGASSPVASATVSVNSPPASSTPAPKGVGFTASTDHGKLVTSYRLEVYASGATPGSSQPVATLNLGKPTPASNGDITIEVPAFFEALAAGNYLATVAAVGSGGTARSPAVAFTR